jgi:hypothetical protein
MKWPRFPNAGSVLVLLPVMPVMIPDADPIPLPAPIGLLQFLLVHTLLLHLLLMNFVLGGSLLALVSHLRTRRAGTETGQYHRRLIAVLARAFPAAMAFTITLGVAPLLFVQVLYGQLFFSSSILMAWLWLAVVALLLVGYYAAYWHSFRHATSKGAPWAVLTFAVVLLTIALLFVSNFSLLQNPEAWRPLYLEGRLGLHLYALRDAEVLPRFVHFVIAALALTGLVVAWIGLRREGAEPAFGRWAAVYGTRWFIGATLMQLGSGIWFLLVQPSRVRDALLGGRLADSAHLAGAAVFALAALAILTPPRRISKVRLSLGTAAIGLTVLLMVLLRQRVRTLVLAPHFRYETLPVASQWGAILIFLVLLLCGIILVAWMLQRFFQQPSRASV